MSRHTEIEKIWGPDDLPEARRDFIKPPAPLDFDEIDEAVASDPVLDHIPQRRHSRGSGRIFKILDDLEQGGGK